MCVLWSPLLLLLCHVVALRMRDTALAARYFADAAMSSMA